IVSAGSESLRPRLELDSPMIVQREVGHRVPSTGASLPTARSQYTPNGTRTGAPEQFGKSSTAVVVTKVNSVFLLRQSVLHHTTDASILGSRTESRRQAISLQGWRRFVRARVANIEN